MADPKLLTENNWKTVSLKLKVKHSELQKALADFDKLQDQDHDDLLQCLAEIKKHALALKKSKEAAANAALVKHLADMLSAAEAEQRDVAKAKADAGKENVTLKKVEHAARKMGVGGGDDDEAENEDGEYADQLLAALQKLKGARDVSYEFIVCEGKPHPCVMIAKKITPKHKEQLSKAAGSKRFLHVGTCRAHEGKFNFSMDKPVTGLAHKLQESIRHHTGKKFPICVGTELVDAEDNGHPTGMPATADPKSKNLAAHPQPVAPPRLGKPELAKAPAVWHSTRDILDKNINELKKAVRGHYANRHPNLLKEIDKNLGRLDGVMAKLDHRLADSLAKAHAGGNDATRQAELKNSKIILADYIKYVKSEPLIAHIDTNPFGVATNLKKVLIDSLTHMAQAIG